MTDKRYDGAQHTDRFGKKTPWWDTDINLIQFLGSTGVFTLNRTSIRSADLHSPPRVTDSLTDRRRNHYNSARIMHSTQPNESEEL